MSEQNMTCPRCGAVESVYYDGRAECPSCFADANDRVIMVASPPGDAATAGASSRDAEIERLRNQIKAWEGITRDELAETLKLMEALGVVAEVKEGRACMDAMLDRISQLTTASKRVSELEAEVARLGGVVAAAVQAEQVARDDSKSLSPLNAFLDKHYPEWTEDGTDDVYINALMAVSEKLDASQAKLSTLEAAANDLCRSTLIDELEARGMPYTAERVRRLCAALDPAPPAKEPTNG